MIKQVELGKTGLNVSRIGLGGIPLTRLPEQEAIEIIRYSIDSGLNFIDTAHAYGKSEEFIGKTINGRRKDLIIATKGGWDKKSTLESIDLSLKRLNTNYIDLWQFHNINNMDKYKQVFDSEGGYGGALEAFESGKIKHIGVSTHSLDFALKLVNSGYFETIQVPFNFICNEAAENLIPLANEKKVGLIAMKPFAGGMLTNANYVFKFLLQFENVVPIPGFQKCEEIDEALQIIKQKPLILKEREQIEINNIRNRIGNQFCRRCGYCMPCPQGVLVSYSLFIPIYHDISFLDSFITEVFESTKNCIECGECEEKCPYHLPIREMIKQSKAFYKHKIHEIAISTE